jgi:hypothetical protein
MAHELPPLPYPYSALEPHIDEATMRIHHDKHHGTYVEKLNAALDDTEWVDRPIEQILDNLDLLDENRRTAVRNNGGGHANHTLFWEIMSPDGGGEPEDDLARAIEDAFDGFNAFKEQFAGAAVNRQRVGMAHPRRDRPCRDLDAKPGLTAHEWGRPTPRSRRLGARLLPPVSEPPPRVHRGLVERRGLGESHRATRVRRRPSGIGRRVEMAEVRTLETRPVPALAAEAGSS